MKTLYQMQVRMYGEVITGLSLAPAAEALADLKAWAHSDARFTPENGVFHILKSFPVPNDYAIADDPSVAHCVEVSQSGKTYGEVVQGVK